jgi:hypothetical protein
MMFLVYFLFSYQQLGDTLELGRPGGIALA